MSPTPDGRMVHTYAMQDDTANAKAAYQDFLSDFHRCESRVRETEIDPSVFVDLPVVTT
jgi:hypothetical protein